MNIVSQIHTNIKSVASTVLGGTWHELRRVFDPEQNDSRTAENAYGVRHGAASSADGVMRYYTMDHSFTVVLSRRFVDRLSDAEIQTVINDLYNKADSILVEVFLKKLSLPTIVLIVDNPSIAEPRVLGNQSVILELSFNVKYRNAVNGI